MQYSAGKMVIFAKRLMFVTVLSWLYVKTVTDFSQFIELCYSSPAFVETILFMFCMKQQNLLMFRPGKLNMNTLPDIPQQEPLHDQNVSQTEINQCTMACMNRMENKNCEY